MAGKRTSRLVAARPPRQPLPRGLRGWTAAAGRRIAALRGLPLAGVLAVLVLGALFARYVFSSDVYRVNDWVVRGAHRVSESDALRLAGRSGGDPPHILLYRLRDAEASVESHPAVHAVRITREFPSRLVVSIREREEAAILVTPAGSWLLDVEGVLFAPAGADTLREDLPPLSVSDGREYAAGMRLDAPVRDALFLYSETIDSVPGFVSREISEIHWDAEQGVVLYLRGGARLVCGRQPPEDALPRAEALARKFGGFEGIDYADLRIESHVPWRALAASEERAVASR